jgi:hypothetical protein
VRPVGIEPGEPSGQVGGAAVGGAVGQGVGPFAQECLDEAFGLAVGPRRIVPGPQVADVEQAAGLGEQPRDVARAVVAHHPLDADAPFSEPAQGTHEKAGAALAALVGQHLDIGQARGVIDGDMNELLAGPVRGVAPAAGDPVAHPSKARQLLDVEMQELAGVLPLVAADRSRRLEPAQATEAGCAATVERASCSLAAISAAVSR